MALETTFGTLWVDIDQRIVHGAQGEIKLSENVLAVYSSIDNILRTSPGEHAFLPQFGFGMKDRLVGESMNSEVLDVVGEEIKREIETWDDRPIIDFVGFFKDPDSNSLFLELRFRIRGLENEYKQVIPVTGEIE